MSECCVSRILCLILVVASSQPASPHVFHSSLFFKCEVILGQLNIIVAWKGPGRRCIIRIKYFSERNTVKTEEWHRV